MDPKLLTIRLYGDPCLRKKSTPVKEVGPGERLLIQSMLETMYHAKGIGLAAPQVGINQRIFVADIGEGPVAVINPKVIRKSGKAELEEGCLSIPGIVVNVKRAQKIVICYTDENNKKVEKECEDLMARVLLHETDHLNGKLITDYASLMAKRKMRGQLKELKALSKEQK